MLWNKMECHHATEVTCETLYVLCTGYRVLILTKGNSSVGVEDGVCFSLQTHSSLSPILL